jgi:hypothetical protein
METTDDALSNQQILPESPHILLTPPPEGSLIEQNIINRSFHICLYSGIDMSYHSTVYIANYGGLMGYMTESCGYVAVASVRGCYYTVN